MWCGGGGGGVGVMVLTLELGRGMPFEIFNRTNDYTGM